MAEEGELVAEGTTAVGGEVAGVVPPFGAVGFVGAEVLGELEGDDLGGFGEFFLGVLKIALVLGLPLELVGWLG